MHGENMTQNCGVDQAVMIDMIDGPHAKNSGLKDLIYRRGLDPATDTHSLLAMSEAIGEKPAVVETETQQERVQ
jgi:hypothetical protein